MDKPKSKSEAKRIAILKGEDMQEAVEEFEKQEKCSYCHDKCDCHNPLKVPELACGCPLAPIL